MTELQKLKIKLGISLTDNSKDELLNLYLSDAEQFILDTTHLQIIPDRLLGAQVDIAIIAYNKQGIEGQTAHSEGGISRTFGDVPDSIMKKIRSCRRLPR